MLRHWRGTLLLLVLTAVSASSLYAQRGSRRGLVELPPEGTRRGFWLAGGLGAGAEAYRFDSEAWTEDLVKPVFSFRLGGTPDQHLRLGGELTSWVNPYTDDQGFEITETLTSIGMVGQFYPIRTAGLFLKGGVGIGFSTATVAGGNTSTESGLMAQYGAGYDIRLSDKLALTPTVEMFRHRFTQRGAETLHERMFHIGIAVTYQR